MNLIAGLLGGLLFATLGTLLITITFAANTHGSEHGLATFSGLLLVGFWIAIAAPHAGKAWRRLLLSSSVLSFLLPLSGILYTGAFLAANTDGGAAAAAGAAIGGTLLSGFLGFVGFFLGVVFLIIGLLVGREKQVEYVQPPKDAV